MEQPIIEEHPMEAEVKQEVKLEEGVKQEQGEEIVDEGTAGEAARANLEEILNQPEMQE